MNNFFKTNNSLTEDNNFYSKFHDRIFFTVRKKFIEILEKLYCYNDLLESFTMNVFITLVLMK